MLAAELLVVPLAPLAVLLLLVASAWIERRLLAEDAVAVGEAGVGGRRMGTGADG